MEQGKKEQTKIQNLITQISKDNILFIFKSFLIQISKYSRTLKKYL